MIPFLYILFIFLQQPGPCQVPEQIIRLVHMIKPTTELVTEEKINPVWKEYLKTECPTVVEGDFNGDGIEDYGLIITDGPYRLIIAESNSDTYRLVGILNIDFGISNRGLGFGMELYPAGTGFAHDGILFEKFGSFTWVYHWNHGKYEKVIIGEPAEQ